MVLVRETVAGDWQALRDIRLEALRDAPTAFGSTYEREAGARGALARPDRPRSAPSLASRRQRLGPPG